MPETSVTQVPDVKSGTPRSDLLARVRPLAHAYFGASGQAPVIGPNASSPGMTFNTL